MEEHRTEADAVREMTEEHLAPRLIALTSGPEVLWNPKSGEYESTKLFEDERRSKPERAAGHCTHQTLTSLIGWTNRSKNESTVAFVEKTGAGATAEVVVDYDAAGDSGAPGFRERRGSYKFPMSQEWEAWVFRRQDWMSSSQMAEFIEDHIGDVRDPASASDAIVDTSKAMGVKLGSPAMLMTISRGVDISTKTQVKSAKNLATGDISVVYDEKSGSSQIEIPGGFVIAIPVFQSGPLYTMFVRLRYRVKDGTISWALVPYQPEQRMDHAVDEAIERLSQECDIDVFTGCAERPAK